MANRLTKIYTRTGDSGETGTADGTRLAKDDLLMHVQGELDELNSVLGLLACKLDDEQLQTIRAIQHVLFDMGGEISLRIDMLKPDRIDALEHHIDECNTTLTPLKEFILPGGNEAGALAHLARTVCRRAERTMVSLNRQHELNPVSLAYINRLSDYLFVLARTVNADAEIYWRSERLGRS